MKKFFLIALGLTLATSVGFADAWNKKTRITISGSFLVPGVQTRNDVQAFSAGTYVFKLMDSLSNRYIVQIWNDEETRLLGTVFAIPAYRTEVTGRTHLIFKQTSRGLALFRWFYPGVNYGWEFPLERLDFDGGHMNDQSQQTPMPPSNPNHEQEQQTEQQNQDEHQSERPNQEQQQNQSQQHEQEMSILR